jgi:folate-binding protein YgfZ
VRDFPLFQFHTKLGKEIGEYHGILLPAYYTNPDDEYDIAFSDVVITDRSYHDILRISGADARDLLHRITTNDLSTLHTKSVVDTIFLTDKGRVIDLVQLLALDEELLLIVSPGIGPIVKQWIERYIILEDVIVEDVTSRISMVSLIGPKADTLIDTVYDIELAQGRYAILPDSGSVELIARSVRNGPQVVDVICSSEKIAEHWQRLTLTDVSSAAAPMGARAYEALRISAGRPMPPGEISQENNPFDLALANAISFTKGCYIGQEVIARLDTYQKVRRGLFGLLSDHRVPIPATIKVKGEEVGRVTGCSQHPIHGRFTSLAVCRTESVCSGTDVEIDAGGFHMDGVMTEIPFILGKVQKTSGQAHV